MIRAALILLLTGCATAHPSLDTLRDRFVSEARDRGVVVRPDAVALSFVPSIDGAAGRCFPNRSPRLVEVSSTVWNDPFYSDATRRQVVYHELGHCLLGLDHVTNLAVNVYGQPARHVSIMEREPLPWDVYAPHEAEWLDRLFGRDMR